MIAAVAPGKVDGIEFLCADKGTELPVPVCASMSVVSNAGACTSVSHDMTGKPASGQPGGRTNDVLRAHGKAVVSAGGRGYQALGRVVARGTSNRSARASEGPG
jgi:hypothetical protein